MPGRATVGPGQASDRRAVELMTAVSIRSRQAGGAAEPDASDVSVPDGARALVDHAVSAFGRLDIVVNNAGIHWNRQRITAAGAG